VTKPNIPRDKEVIMGTFTATMIAEGVEEASSEEEYLEAWQLLINTGLAWQLQGWFGRTAKELIDAGLCTMKGRS
jgi:hypothetical protein